MKILLQDHYEGMRAVIRPMLTGRGISFVEATDPWEAAALAVQHRPDIVLLAGSDVYGEGQDALRLFGNDPNRPKLLVLGATEPHSPLVPRLPVDGYLPYPFDRGKLMDAIQRLLSENAGPLAAGAATSNVTVLVIEDEPRYRDLLKLNLSRRGYRLLLAPNGLAGLTLVKSRRPDLVILDLMLPDMDGYEICRKIRHISPVPIVLLTAEGAETEEADRLKFADHCITKPFGADELLAHVEAVLLRVKHRPTATGCTRTQPS